MPILALLSLAAVSAAAPDALRDRGAPGLDAIRASAVSAHVRFLADDLLEGREPGKRGHAIAEAYVATQLAALGLAPAGVGGTFFQPVPMRSWRIDRERSRLAVRGRAGPVPLEPDTDYVLTSDGDRAEVDVAAPLVFAGYGVVAPEFGWDDLRGVDVRGRIAVVLDTAPRSGASGLASLLEAARAFAALPRPPRRSILFVAVTGEESGLVGSEYLARHPLVPNERIVADVNLDAPVAGGPLRDVVPIGADESTIAVHVRAAAAALGLAVSPDPKPEQVAFVRSDQYSFVREGIPSLFLVGGWLDETGGTERKKAAWERWVRERYHSPKDAWDPAYDWEALATCARAEFLVGLSIAEDDARPRWNDGSFLRRFERRPAASSATAAP